MRYDHALPAVALLALFGACAEGPTSLAPETDALVPFMDATTAPTREAFQGFVFFCSSGPPDRAWVTPGGTFHFRNAGNTNQWEVGHPLIDGIETNEVDLNLELKGGVGFAHGTSTLVPNAVNGTWQMEFHVDLSNGTAQGVGRGTGDLQGMSLTWANVVTAIPPNPCNPALGGAETTGIITTPGRS